MRKTLLITLPAILLPVLVVGPATAAPAPPAAARGTITEVRRTGAAVDPRGYWTADRRRSAVPLDDFSGHGKPTVGTPAAPEPVARHAKATAAPRAAALRAAALNESITVGKIFFTHSTTGRDSYCSASVVNSTARNMVFTAAHCLHDGPGRTWHTANWMFVPSYRDGAQPYGTWDWSTLAVPTGWINSRDRQYDVGVALVFGSRSVVDAVGANGLLTGGGREYHYDVFGYPGNRDDGEVQWVCSGTSRQAGIFTPNQIEINCPWGGGASGGPWYYRYDNTARNGDVHGVSSYADDADNPSYIGSPYFSDAVVGSLYRTYADRTW